MVYYIIDLAKGIEANTAKDAAETYARVNNIAGRVLVAPEDRVRTFNVQVTKQATAVEQ